MVIDDLYALDIIQDIIDNSTDMDLVTIIELLMDNSDMNLFAIVQFCEAYLNEQDKLNKKVKDLVESRKAINNDNSLINSLQALFSGKNKIN